MTTTTRTDYLQLFESESEAMSFEESVLQVGREYLPAAAVRVLEDQDQEPAPEYWQFLIGQKVQVDNEAEAE